MKKTSSSLLWSIQKALIGRAEVAHPFDLLGIASVFNGSLFSSMHGSLVTSILIRETTENESVNKVNLIALKRKIEGKKEARTEEIPDILWPRRTTHKDATGETLFHTACRAEAMIP